MELHRLVQLVRVAEIAMDQVADVEQELLEHRLVEIIGSLKGCDLAGACPRAENPPRRATGNEVQQQERQQRDAQKYHD